MTKTRSVSNPRLASLAGVLLMVVFVGSYAIFLEYQNNAYLQRYVAANAALVSAQIAGLLVFGFVAAYLAYFLTGANTATRIGRAIRRIGPYANWNLAALVLGLSITLSLLDLADPYLIKVLIDNVLIPKKLSLLWVVFGLFLLVEFFSTTVGVGFTYFQRMYEEKVMLRLRRDLFEHLEGLDADFHNKTKIGDLLSRFSNDVPGIQDLIETISITFRDFVLGVGTFVIIYLINWQVAVFSLIVLPFYAVVNYRFGPRVRVRAKNLRRTAGELASFLQERLSSVKTIKTFQTEKEESRAYERQGLDQMRAQLRFTLFSRGVNGLLHYAGYLPVYFVLAFGGLEVLGGSLSIGGLVAVYSYVTRLLGPFSTFGQFGIQTQQNMAAVDRVFEIFDREPAIVDREDAVELETVLGAIAFDSVSFEYPRGEAVLQKVSFVAKPGQRLALVGPSGVGKTTVAELMCRFYDPSSGSILLDGIELRDIKLHSLRQHVGVVSQRAVLYNISIKENIRYGRSDATEEEIVLAEKLAGVHAFVATLAQGHDTIVGERGALLSEGQKQRIALARMLLKNPSILILDEATSSLDAESEEKIHKAIDELMRHKTVFIIAHRLSTVKHVDRILVLRHRRITEQGTFDELMRRKGDFYELFRQQSELEAVPKMEKINI